MTAADDLITRIAVLAAVSRGMSFAYTARTTSCTIAQVREIAEAAGWPDITAVSAEWKRLRQPGPGRVPRRQKPSRPDVSVARVRTSGLAFREALTVRPGDDGELSAETLYEPDAPTEPAPVPAVQPVAPPPATNLAARQLPCEVCGLGVLTSYVERTGRQRHGHHAEVRS